MKKIIFILPILLVSCSSKTNGIIYEELTKNIVKETQIGNGLNNIELLEYKGHDYMVYRDGSGVAMLHLESCKCKNTSNE